jgi:hypothetical protein
MEDETMLRKRDWLIRFTPVPVGWKDGIHSVVIPRVGLERYLQMSDLEIEHIFWEGSPASSDRQHVTFHDMECHYDKSCYYCTAINIDLFEERLDRSVAKLMRDRARQIDREIIEDFKRTP